MTAAATGNCVTGRNRGWRKAVRYALTENPVTGRVGDRPIIPEFFRLVSESFPKEANPSFEDMGTENTIPTSSTHRSRR